MGAENTFNIEVLENGHTIPLTVKRNEDIESMKFDIYNERMVLLFSLDCCSDDVKDTYKLSKEFEDKNIDPALIETVNEILMGEEE